MELNADLRPPAQKAIASLEPSHLWVLGLAVDDDGSLAGPGSRGVSLLAECECPDNCPRDHENE
jgi:hypothetical protein